MLTRAFRLSILTYLNQLAIIILFWLQVKISTHFVSVKDYGSWDQIIIAINFLTVILSLNLGHGFIRFSSSFSEGKKKITFTTVLISQLGVILLVSLIMSPLWSHITMMLVDKSSLLIYVLISLISLLQISISNIQNYLLVNRKEINMIFQNLIQYFLDLILVALLVFCIPDIYGLIVGYALSKMLSFLIFFVVNRIYRISFVFSIDILKTLLRFSLPLILVSLSYWVTSSSARYFINYYWGLEKVAMFAIPNRILMFIVMLFSLISTIFLSNISKLYDSGNRDRVDFWFSNILVLYFSLGILGGSFLIMTSKYMTLLLSNANYTFDDMSFVYMFVVTGNLAYGGVQILSKIYDLEKKVISNGINYLFIMLLNIVLSVLLIPRFGLIGASLSIMISFVLGFVVVMCRRPMSVNLDIPWGRFLVFMIVSFSFSVFFSESKDMMSLTFFNSFIIPTLITVFYLLVGISLKVISVKQIVMLIRR